MSATSQEFNKAVDIEDIKQHTTTGAKKGLSSGKVNAAGRGSSAAEHAAKEVLAPAVGKISKTYADKLTAYLGLDPAATESARTAALAELAAALPNASKKLLVPKS